MKFLHQLQKGLMDCGPTCLHMISRFHGKNMNIETIRNHTELGKEGVNLFGISNAAEQLGFRTISVEISIEKLIKKAPLPGIIHWDKNHFVIVAPTPL